MTTTEGEVRQGVGDDLGLTDTAAYIRGRQTPEGGFSFYRAWGIEEPGAADTWYAVATLAALGTGPERREDCINWLWERQDADGGYPGLATAWHVTGALAHLSAAPRHSPADWLAPYSGYLFDGLAEGDDTGEFLLNLARYVELRNRLSLGLEPRYVAAVEAALVRLRDENGAFPRGAANLVDSAVALRLISAAGLLGDRRLLEYALACEDPVCGFRAAIEGQSTHLEVLAAGIAIMQHFGAAPTYPRALLNLVTACRHRDGGFGRHIGAVVTLRDTCLAVYVIRNIKIHL